MPSLMPALTLAAAGALIIGTASTAVARTPAPTCNGLRATIVGTAHADRITGTAHADVIVGLGGDDVIRGGGGNDTICGGPGADRLFGGAGNDKLFGQRDHFGNDRGGSYLAGDTLSGGPGNDYLDGGVDPRKTEQGRDGDTISYASSSRPVVVNLSARPGFGKATGDGTDTIKVQSRLTLIGSRYADRLTGTKGDDHLEGGPGSDTIYGLGGDDALDPEGDDLTKQAPDADVVYGGTGNDSILGWMGRDELHGGPGNDEVGSFAKAPARVYGDSGNDDVVLQITRASGYAAEGGSGTDSLKLLRPGLEEGSKVPAGTEVPLVTVRVAPGTIHAGWKHTSHGTFGGFESYWLDDNYKWDYFGTNAADKVQGGYFFRLHAWTYGGNDNVVGSGVNDYIDAGAGTDTVDGSEGYDTCLHAEHRYGCERTTP